GNIVYVANNIITSGGNTTEDPPGGTGTNNGTAAVNVDIEGTTLFSYGSTWKYWDQNTRPSGWQNTAFVDGSWPSGPGQFGYGDGDESTIINYGPSSTTKYITTYFRKAINIANIAAYSSFIMSLKYDDGFVVYVNGTEVNRTTMHAGGIAHSTLAPALAETTVALSIP